MNSDQESEIGPAGGSQPAKAKGSAERTRVQGALRWTAGRLMGLGLDWRQNMALNDERRGTHPPVMRVTINWRGIAQTPSAKTADGLRRLVAREVADGLLDAADYLRTGGADPDFPEWKVKFEGEKPDAVKSLVNLLVDGKDPGDFWEQFLRDFQVAYPQLEKQRDEEFFQRTGYWPKEVVFKPDEDE